MLWIVGSTIPTRISSLFFHHNFVRDLQNRTMAPWQKVIHALLCFIRINSIFIDTSQNFYRFKVLLLLPMHLNSNFPNLSKIL